MYSGPISVELTYRIDDALTPTRTRSTNLPVNKARKPRSAGGGRRKTLTLTTDGGSIQTLDRRVASLRTLPEACAGNYCRDGA